MQMCAAFPKLEIKTNFMSILFLLALVGVLSSTVFEGMALTAAARYLAARRTRKKATVDFTPPVSILKPLHGSFPQLADFLRAYFELDYPNYEILFCAHRADDPGLEVARSVAAQYPQVPVKFLHTGEPPWINARCYSLSFLVAAAQHEIMVITDPDVRVTSDYLSSMVQQFSSPKIDVVTCMYRGTPINAGLWERLEALGMSVEMTAGVVVADMLEGVRFTLGPSTAVRRGALDAIGGFQALSSYAADDYMLGKLVSDKGGGVVLGDYAVDHCIFKSSFRKTLDHQLSWMRSTRFSRPKGHFGTGLTFAVPYGILALLFALPLGHPWLGIAIFAWTFIARVILSVVEGGLVVRDSAAIKYSFLYPLRDLMGFALWIASYWSPRLLWHGRVFRLLPGGTIERWQS